MPVFGALGVALALVLRHPTLLLSISIAVNVFAGAAAPYAAELVPSARWPLFATVIGLLFLYSAQSDQSPWRKGPAVTSLLLVAWGFVAVPVGLNPPITAGRATSLLLLFALVFGVLPRLARDQRTYLRLVDAVLWPIGVVAVVSAGLGLLGAPGAIQNWPPGTPERLVGFLQTPNQLAVLCMLGVPVLIGKALSLHGYQRTLLLSLAGVTLIVVAWTWSRGAAVGVGASLLTMLVPVVRRMSMRTILLTGLLFTFAAFVSVVGCTAIERCTAVAAGRLDSTTFENRISLWRTGLDSLNSAPALLVGNGLGSAEELSIRADLTSEAGISATGSFAGVRLHNSFVEALAEMGIIGVGLLGLLLVQLLIAAVRGFPSTGQVDWVRLGLVAATVGFLVHENFESFLLAVGGSAAIPAWCFMSLAAYGPDRPGRS